MSGPPPDRPFSETEKVVLLAEILKWSDIPSSILVDIVRQHQIEPAWSDITRPSGRGLPACQRALREMITVVPPPPTPLHYYDPAAFSQQRSYVEPNASAPGRTIVPRPQGMQHSAYPPSTSPYSQSPSTAEPPRKRGRPSNADIERRRLAAEARGETYVPPPARPRKPKTRVSGTPSEVAASALGDTSRRESNTDPIATPPNHQAPTPVLRATTSPALSHASHGSKRVRSPEFEPHERRFLRREGDDVPRSMNASSQSRGPHWPSATHPSPWSQPPNRPTTPLINSLPRSQPRPTPSESSLAGPAAVLPQSRGEPSRSPRGDGDRWTK